MKIPIFDQISDTEDLYEDAMFWTLPKEEDYRKDTPGKHIGDFK